MSTNAYFKSALFLNEALGGSADVTRRYYVTGRLAAATFVPIMPALTIQHRRSTLLYPRSH